MPQTIDLYTPKRQAMADALDLLRRRQEFNAQKSQYKQNYDAQMNQWGAENAADEEKRGLEAAKAFNAQTAGLMPEERDRAAQQFIQQYPNAARFIQTGLPATFEQQYKRDVFSDGPSAPAQPAPQGFNSAANGVGVGLGGGGAAPQQQAGIGDSFKKEVQRALLVFGPDGVKQLVESGAMQISQLPPQEQMNALRVMLKTAVDANTKDTNATNERNNQRTTSTSRYVADTGKWTQGVDANGRMSFTNPALGGKTISTDQQPVSTYNAGQNGGKPASMFERRAMNFYMRAEDATKTLESKDKSGSSLEDRIAGYGLARQGQLQYAPNILQGDDMQMYRQLQRQFTEARLRKDSGAAIPEHEIVNDARTYFAQPGDGPVVLEQKRKARQNILDALRQEAGRAYSQYYSGTPSPDGVVYVDPNTGEPIQ